MKTCSGRAWTSAVFLYGVGGCLVVAIGLTSQSSTGAELLQRDQESSFLARSLSVFGNPYDEASDGNGNDDETLNASSDEKANSAKGLPHPNESAAPLLAVASGRILTWPSPDFDLPRPKDALQEVSEYLAKKGVGAEEIARYIEARQLILRDSRLSGSVQRYRDALGEMSRLLKTRSGKASVAREALERQRDRLREATRTLNTHFESALEDIQKGGHDIARMESRFLNHMQGEGAKERRIRDIFENLRLSGRSRFRSFTTRVSRSVGYLSFLPILWQLADLLEEPDQLKLDRPLLTPYNKAVQKIQQKLGP